MIQELSGVVVYGRLPISAQISTVTDGAAKQCRWYPHLKPNLGWVSPFRTKRFLGQEVAEYVAGMARRRGFGAAAESLDSVPIPQVLECPLAVFIVSTTGDGEVPSNMSAFWRFLLRRYCCTAALLYSRVYVLKFRRTDFT